MPEPTDQTVPSWLHELEWEPVGAAPLTRGTPGGDAALPAPGAADALLHTTSGATEGRPVEAVQANHDTGHRAGTPRTTASGRIRADRAAQFMPFAALRGYYELIRKQARVPEPRHELTEEEAAALSHIVRRVRRRQIVRVTYYDCDAYVTCTGCVTHIDLAARELVVIKTKIPLDDIRALEIVEPASGR